VNALADIEAALWRAAARCLPAAALERKALVAAIERQSLVYTRERDRLGGPAGVDASTLAARALFFTVADAPKIAVPIAELDAAGRLPSSDPVRVLDLGAGCGAMTLGLAAALPGRRLAVTAVDHDPDALAILAGAAAELDAVELETRVADAGAVGPAAGSLDLIVMGSVLNELDEAAAAARVESLLGALAPGGAAIVIEPALREIARRVHRLRDRLIAGGAHIFAPCTRTAAPCPALADERDWCHEDRPFDPPSRLAALTRATGLRQHRLKFAYLVVRDEPGTVAGDRAAMRVVSRLKKTKGASELFACGEEGRLRLRLQKRDRSAANRSFSRARRGELLIGDGDALEIVDPTKAPDSRQRRR
jgi:SAM-dependent methyltransferase